MGVSSSRQEENNKRSQSSNNSNTGTKLTKTYDEKLKIIINKYFFEIKIIDIKPIVSYSTNNNVSTCFYDHAGSITDDSNKSTVIGIKYNYETIKTTNNIPAINFTKENKYIDNTTFSKTILLTKSELNSLNPDNYDKLFITRYGKGHTKEKPQISIPYNTLSTFNIIFSGFNPMKR